MRAGFVDDVTRERCRGITYLLERVFWPTYSYARALRGAPRAGPSSNTFTGRRAGFKRGSAVDAELCALVNRGIAATHPYTIKIIKALDVAGLRPVKAQVHVTSPAHGLGTGVDLLCARALPGGGERLVVVEIKCGFNRTEAYERSTGPMKRFLKHLPNSPRNQHAVQTTVTRAIFLACHPEVTALDAVVLRVTDAGVFLHAVDRSLYATAEAIMAALCAARDRHRVRRPKLRKKVRAKKPRARRINA